MNMHNEAAREKARQAAAKKRHEELLDVLVRIADALHEANYLRRP